MNYCKLQKVKAVIKEFYQTMPSWVDDNIFRKEYII